MKAPFRYFKTSPDIIRLAGMMYVRTGLSYLRFLFYLHSPTGHYDEPETLSHAMPLVCSIGADVRQYDAVHGAFAEVFSDPK